jgi:hypothetical protein
MRKRNLLRLLPGALLVAACGSPVDPGPTETAVTFQYRLGEGATWADFSARGLQPDGTSLSTPGPWVFVGGSSTTMLLAPHQQVGEEWLTLWVYLPLVFGPEQMPLGSSEAGSCPGPEVIFCTPGYFRIRGASGASQWCPFTDGELAFTRRDTEWVSGTFSATATCTRDGVQRPLEIRNGRFDVGYPLPVPAPPG